MAADPPVLVDAVSGLIDAAADGGQPVLAGPPVFRRAGLVL